MITSGILAVVVAFSGTTTGQPLVAGPTCTCGPPSSPQAVVSWTATGAGTATATTCPETMYDSILSVRDATGHEVGCSDDTDSTHSCSTISWSVTAGSAWTLAITGCRGTSGPYALHIAGPDATSADPCPFPPSYPRDFSDPPCTAAHESDACRCSECFHWDASPSFTQGGTSKPITEYEVWRAIDSIGTFWPVGIVKTRHGGALDDGAIYPDKLPTMWCAAWDSSLPAEGVLYRYGVRACGGSPRVCSAGMSSVTRYRGAPVKVLP